MKKNLIGLLAGFALSLAAFADQNSKDEGGKDRASDSSKSAPASQGIGQSSSASSSRQTDTSTPQLGHSDDRPASSLETHHDLAKNEVTGKIVRAEPNTVWIDHMGAVIPLKIDSNTRFESAGIARPKDLKEGQEIRASFRVQNNTTNVADSIWLEGATATGTQPSTSRMDSHRTATSPKRPDTSSEEHRTNPSSPSKDVK